LREDCLAKSEHGEDVHAIRLFKLIIWNVLKFFVSPLEGGIVYKDVDIPERIDGFAGYGLANSRLADVPGKEQGPSTGFGDETFRLASVGLSEFLP
jgi:hypothetical protein